MGCAEKYAPKIERDKTDDQNILFKTVWGFVEQLISLIFLCMYNYLRTLRIVIVGRGGNFRIFDFLPSISIYYCIPQFKKFEK